MCFIGCSREDIIDHWKQLVVTSMKCDAIVKLYKVLIDDHGETIYNGKVQAQVSDDLRFSPYFKDCLGALDGTHIIASVLEDKIINFRSSRSNKITPKYFSSMLIQSRIYIYTCWMGGNRPRSKKFR
ncbi:hypothetical protein GIB67_004973 [Kingdonia uniflora]|uniref:DDE Tnp4 domain-containing protein n=1 Tax=Kingdonia uniflora TaxID=39325 RepID=A0A7J7NMG3_9MAGN|nr:hypothetical protein GIB67_004973 [Kingdonia uniflora]